MKKLKQLTLIFMGLVLLFTSCQNSADDKKPEENENPQENLIIGKNADVVIDGSNYGRKFMEFL